MFSSTLSCSTKFSMPLTNRFGICVSRHLSSKATIHPWPHNHAKTVYLSHMTFKTLLFPRWATAASHFPFQLIQKCQFSTAGVRYKDSVVDSQKTKSRPVRTESDCTSQENKSSVGDENTADGVKDGSTSDSKQPQILQRYTQAKEKMQEKIDQVKDTKENILTIPNLLTMSRIALSPVLGYLVIQEYYTLAASLFLVTSATDVLDGWIARNFKNQQSVLGSIIDPFADKVLITILTLSLTISGLIPVPLTFVIIGRDVMLVTGVFWLRYKSLPPPKTISRYFDVTHTTVKLQPTTISKEDFTRTLNEEVERISQAATSLQIQDSEKYNTVVQVALVGLSLGAPVFNYVDHPLLQALWYITATTTFVSGLSYIFLNKHTFKILKKGGKDL